MPHYNVVAAAVLRDGRFLCMKRTRSHFPYTSEKWEFPGGKIKAGETHEQALLREINEEMGWSVVVKQKIASIDHAYPDFSITLHLYLCDPGEGEFRLYSHLDYKWLTIEEMPELSWTEADRQLLPFLPKPDASAE